MSERLFVGVAGADGAYVEQAAALLTRQADLVVESHRIGGNGHADPLYAFEKAPDLLVLIVSSGWEVELGTLGKQCGFAPPPLVVVAPGNDARIMRQAMRVGARDFIGMPIDEDELLRCVRQIGRERPAPAAGNSSLIAFINSKGGSGASLVASNLAHVLADQGESRVALLDFDLQFGSQDLRMDLPPKGSLLEAIHMADSLDAPALEGFMSKHSSGVHLLGAFTEVLPLPWETPPAKLGKFLDVAIKAYEHVVADLPRQIDPVTTTVLERADRIFVVMNQSLIHLRDTRQILGMLTRDLGVQSHQVRVLINRHDSDSTVSKRDIEETLDMTELFTIPDDFPRAMEATNLGVPLHTTNPGAPISKAITELGSMVAGSPLRQRKGLRSKIVNWIRQ